MKKISLKEAIDKARESFQPQVPTHPVQFDGAPKPLPKTLNEPVIVAKHDGSPHHYVENYGLSVGRMTDAMPLLAALPSYGMADPDKLYAPPLGGRLEVKDGAVGLVENRDINKLPALADEVCMVTDSPTHTVAEAIATCDRRVMDAMNNLTEAVITRPTHEDRDTAFSPVFAAPYGRTPDLTAEMLDALPFLLRNMVEENGKTIKQNNLSRSHNIPLDTLVELESGVRLFVTEHTRDCDGTPLYTLAEYQTTSEEGTPIYLSTGHGEDSLRTVKRPTKLPEFTLKRFDTAEAIVADHWGIEVGDIADSICTVAPRMDNGKFVLEKDVPMVEWLEDVRNMGIWGFADTINGVISYWINAAAPVTMDQMVEFFTAVEAQCELEAGLAGELAAAAYRLVKDAVLTNVVKES